MAPITGIFISPTAPQADTTQTVGSVVTSRDDPQRPYDVTQGLEVVTRGLDGMSRGLDGVTRGVDRLSGWTVEGNEQMLAGWDEGEQLSTDSSGTTELICPNWAASPEELHRLKAMTLAVIGLVGFVIVGFMLLCMLYNNDRLMESMRPKFEKKKKPVPGMNLAFLVNTTLQTSIPAIRLSPGKDIPGVGGGRGSASPGDASGSVPAGFGGLLQKSGKHFPTPKNMLVDVSPSLASGGQTPPLLMVSSGKEVLPQGVMAVTHAPQPIDTLGIVAGGDATTACRFPEKPCDYQKQRQTYNDTSMRRHHPGAQGGSLYGCSTAGQNSTGQSHHLSPLPRCPDEESQSGGSWYSDDTPASFTSGEDFDDERRDSSVAFWEEDDDFHAESRRGARGERTKHSMKSRDQYSDKYGNSMSSKRGPLPQEQSSQSPAPHEVSYMSGRFW